MAKIERTSAGLRDALFDELDKLRTGDGDVQEALAVAKVVGQIINVARAEMEFHERMNKDDKLCDDFMTGSLQLGTRDKAPSRQGANAVSVINGATGRTSG